MNQTVHIRYAYAYYSNPVVGQGTKTLNKGERYTTDGIEISVDHRTITLEKYKGDYDLTMECTVTLKPNLFSLLSNLITQKPLTRPRFIKVKSKTVFPLRSVLSVTFSNGWDDNTHSFSII